MQMKFCGVLHRLSQDYILGLVATKPVFGVGLTKRDSNQFPQLHRQARILKFCLKQSLDMILSSKRTNKGAYQSARMRRLVCAFVVRKPPKTGFFVTRPISYRVLFREGRERERERQRETEGGVLLILFSSLTYVSYCKAGLIPVLSSILILVKAVEGWHMDLLINILKSYKRRN